MVILISSENEQFVVDKEIIKSDVLAGSMLESEHTAWIYLRYLVQISYLKISPLVHL